MLCCSNRTDNNWHLYLDIDHQTPISYHVLFVVRITANISTANYCNRCCHNVVCKSVCWTTHMHLPLDRMKHHLAVHSCPPCNTVLIRSFSSPTPQEGEWTVAQPMGLRAQEVCPLPETVNFLATVYMFTVG